MGNMASIRAAEVPLHFVALSETISNHDIASGRKAVARLVIGSPGGNHDRLIREIVLK